MDFMILSFFVIENYIVPTGQVNVCPFQKDIVIINEYLCFLKLLQRIRLSARTSSVQLNDIDRNGNGTLKVSIPSLGILCVF